MKTIVNNKGNTVVIYADMNGIEVWQRICNDCYQSACGDI